uniref:Uncharacterized protein n=1 Tax=Arundo donax TaxID=35708 RepID=A0A0A9A4G6_ARUDO
MSLLMVMLLSSLVICISNLTPRLLKTDQMQPTSIDVFYIINTHLFHG